MKRKKLNNKGMSLVEILISVMLLVPIFTGVMYTFVKGVEFSELSSHSSSAVLAVRNKITEIENTPLAQIASTYHQVTFTAPDLNGIGVTFVDDTDPTMLEVKAVFCWQEKNGRIIGEDLNLNGQLDSGENLDGNNELDSLVQLTTIVQ